MRHRWNTAGILAVKVAVAGDCSVLTIAGCDDSAYQECISKLDFIYERERAKRPYLVKIDDNRSRASCACESLGSRKDAETKCTNVPSPSILVDDYGNQVSAHMLKSLNIQ